MNNLDTKIEYLPSIGPKTAQKFHKLGLVTLYDLLFDFPRRYEDYTTTVPIAEIPVLLADRWQNPGTFTIGGTILGIVNKTTRRRGFTVTEAVVVDETGSIKVVWFNQPFLQKMLKPGSRVILNGRVNYDKFADGYVLEAPVRVDRPRIRPVYSETAGITSFYFEKIIAKIIPLAGELEDWLPEQLCQKPKAESQKPDERSVLGVVDALRAIHAPKNQIELAAAKRRFAFEELFLISLRSQLAKDERQKQKALQIKIDPERLKGEVSKLPYELTADQQKALWQIASDLAEPTPMARLLNGDVGSGKTVVAALAAWIVKQSKMKTLFMVPTSILAVQHFETLKRLFGDQLSIGLKTSGHQEIYNSKFKIFNECQNPNLNDKKQEIKNLLRIDDCDLIVGTHALIQKGVEFENVGLVVVDEQHRFGVKQRQKLLEIGNEDEFRPHFLSMTATPIPRTLHLALFGDLDLSLIKEKPANRKEIKTRFVESANRQKAYEFIRAHLKAGRQAFVICPLIEEKDDKKVDLFEEDRKSVLAEYERLKKDVFPEFEIAMLHGKMKAAEKEAIMADFVANKSKILVSTSVVEVGVDVPNATVMMIEDAERFGLAQIHQFRGRVGRGEHQSFCLLFSGSRSEKALQRLRALEATADGFKLAEIDLETRGPGAIFGTEQSGSLDLKMANLSDWELIDNASKAAKEIAPELNNFPLLKEKLEQFESSKHLE